MRWMRNGVDTAMSEQASHFDQVATVRVETAVACCSLELCGLQDEDNFVARNCRFVVEQQVACEAAKSHRC